MNSVVEIPGVGVVEFPDSMTPDAVNAAAAKLYAEAKPKTDAALSSLRAADVKPMASHAPVPAKPFTPPAPVGAPWMPMATDALKGARAGLISSGVHIGDIFRRMTGAERIIDKPDVQALMTPPDSLAGKVGFFGEQAAEFAVPLTKISGAMRGASLLKRVGADAGASAAVAGLQSGGDPTTTAIGAAGGALVPAAGGAFRGVQRAAAGAREGGVGGAVASAIRTAAPAEPKAMVVQAIKPRATATRFDQSLDLAMPEIKATGAPINGVDDLLKATTEAKKRVRAQYDAMAGPKRAAGWQVNLSGVADAMERSIPKKLQLENPDAALKLQTAAQVYRKPFSLDDAEQLLKETNAELEGLYNKYPPQQRRALLSDPEYARLNAQAVEMRNAIYAALDTAGNGAAARELQRRYGALLEVELETYRRANVAARQQPQSLSEQLSAARAAGDIARGAWRLVRGDLTGAADVASGVAMRNTSQFLREQQTADALIRRAFQAYDRTPTPVDIPPPPQIRGLLGRGPTVTPPPADGSFVRGVPAMPSHSTRPALPAGRPPIEAPPAPDRSFVRGVPAEPARREVRGLLGAAAEPPKPRRVFHMGGDVQPDASRVGSVPAQPLAYDIDPSVPAKQGVRVSQFAGDPEAQRAAIASPEVQTMLRRMLADLDTFEPQRGRLVRGQGSIARDTYAHGAAGSPVANDIGVISEQHVSNDEIKGAITDLLRGEMPTTRVHTAALDAAMGYLEKRSGYHAPTAPADLVDVTPAAPALPGRARLQAQLAEVVKKAMKAGKYGSKDYDPEEHRRLISKAMALRAKLNPKGGS